MITAIRARLQGRNHRAYTSRRAVTDLLHRQEGQSSARERHHQQQAARLAQALDYQPGLLDLHADLIDIAAYLEALAAQARRTGHPGLAATLRALAATVSRAVDQVTTATTATVTN